MSSLSAHAGWPRENRLVSGAVRPSGIPAVLLSLSLAACTGVIGDVGVGGGAGGGSGGGSGGADAGGLDGSTEDAGFDGGIDAGPVDAGAWGYDARPANPTCIAPAPPPNGSGVTTQRAFPNLSFNQPLQMVQPPGEPGRIMIEERLGRIRTFPNQANAMPASVTLFLDISGKVDASGEGGFLGMAFHPQWATKKEIFVSYTETSAPLRSVIARYKSNDNGATIDPASEERLLTVEQPFTNHNGGNIAFGPDGLLYIGFGDGGSGGDPLGSGQRLNTILGKFLRIDVDVPAAQKYAIPPGNPFANQTVCNRASANTSVAAGLKCAEIYATGVRNPWRWSFDTGTGELWCGDVGQDTYEEVDKIALGGNYGWNTREGKHCYNAATCATAGFIDPIVEYNHTEGQSITGGYVYRGAPIPFLVGKFVYGDYQTGRIWIVDTDAVTGVSAPLLLVDTNIAIAGWGQLLDGEVYALDIGNGQIFQLVASGAPPPDTFPRTLTATGCVDPADAKVMAAGVIPYSINSTLWSDGAAKERYFAIPDGSTITVKADGDFDFPIGTVLLKTFLIAGKRIETRYFVRHMNGNWAGYSYEWNAAETDATLLPAGKARVVGTQTWSYPSRGQCLGCHTAIAGRTLGPELGQFNRLQRYPTGRTRNQLETLDGLGYFAAPLGMTAAMLPRFPDPFGTDPLEDRARAYLHSNCSNCHRLGAGQGPQDFRYSLPLVNTNLCNQDPINGTLGVTGAKLIFPGDPTKSIVSLRVHALDSSRMPPMGTSVVDTTGVALLDQWITSLTACP